MRDVMNSVHILTAITPVAARTDNTAVVSDIIDPKDYESLTFGILAGTNTDANAAFAVTMDRGDDFALSDAAAAGSAALIGPPLPPGAGAVWRCFLDLHAGRGWTDSGMAQPIPLTEIEAWCRLNDRRLSPDDLTMLRLLDGEYRASTAETPPANDADDDWSAQ